MSCSTRRPCEWVFADDEGRQLRRQPAAAISRESIMGLAVTNRRRDRGLGHGQTSCRDSAAQPRVA